MSPVVHRAPSPYASHDGKRTADPRQDRAGRRVDSNDLVLLVACDPERAGAVRDPIQAEAMPGRGRSGSGRHLALLRTRRSYRTRPAGCREPHRCAHGGAPGWRRAGGKNWRRKRPVRGSISGAGLVEARHPEVPVAGEDPRVVEVTAGPLLGSRGGSACRAARRRASATRYEPLVRPVTSRRAAATAARGDDGTTGRDQLPTEPPPQRSTPRAGGSRRHRGSGRG